ncbi:MAG: HPr family phosphocarrier protein [Spirochaetales bacterium]|nr:HPr family phosphocarrier protein [Spirochaetales bacterium]
MVQMNAIIRNAAGIHCRPSALIFKHTEHYNGKIFLSVDGEKTELTSIMDIIALGLHKGDMVMIQVSGQGEDEMIKQLACLFETCFDFPPREKSDQGSL